MNWRLHWSIITPDPNSTDPQSGVGDYVHASCEDAYRFIDQHFHNLLGAPPMSWVAESEDGISHRLAFCGAGWKPLVLVEPEAPMGTPFPPSMLEQVKEFHRAFNIAIDQQVDQPLLNLRMRLVNEEADELSEAAILLDMAASGDSIAGLKTAKAHFMKELCDLLYVALGTGIAFGMPLEKAFQAVHASNMSKLGVDGRPIMRDDGKVLKGHNYHEAYLLDLTY